MIWGINTLFLLDAGLSNLAAFAINAFFTAGMVIFEVPTGVIADTWGRKASYLLGVATLALSTLLYLYMWQISAPFWGWALASILLGLGFTFFSGATEAWLVDALKFSGYTGKLDVVFGRGQVAAGVAMLGGSVGGGIIAQVTNLGVPYLLRTAILVLNFIVALIMMKDWGFTPVKDAHPVHAVRHVLNSSIENGLRRPAIKWIMLSAPLTAGVGFYAFYAMQPYLLELYGNQAAYGIAGLAAALLAGAQIIGGLAVGWVASRWRRRTTFLIASVCTVSLALIVMGLSGNFWVAIIALLVWALVFAAAFPVRQAYLNSLIHSEHRATVLSFDSLIGSSGGVVVQPVLGKAADIWSYGTSYVIGGILQLASVPFIMLARKHSPPSDRFNFVSDADKPSPRHN